MGFSQLTVRCPPKYRQFGSTSKSKNCYWGWNSSDLEEVEVIWKWFAGRQGVAKRMPPCLSSMRLMSARHLSRFRRYRNEQGVRSLLLEYDLWDENTFSERIQTRQLEELGAATLVRGGLSEGITFQLRPDDRVSHACLDQGKRTSGWETRKCEGLQQGASQVVCSSLLPITLCSPTAFHTSLLCITVLSSVNMFFPPLLFSKTSRR